MNNKNEELNRPEELVITREFDAPRQLVWDAHSDPMHLVHWWGPEGFTMEILEMDFREGGILHYMIRNKQGFSLGGKILYHRIQAPEWMEFTSAFANEAGELIRHPMSDTWPMQIYNILRLEDLGDRTSLELRSRPIDATDVEIRTYIDGFDSVRGGFKGTFAKLDEYLESLKT